MNAVALLYGDVGLVPTADNGGVPGAYFSVLVQNLAYTKLVGIWGHVPGAPGTPGTWSFTPCSYSHSVPGNLEIWTLFNALPIDQFDVEYQALGNIYWDNNADYNYSLDPILAATVFEGAIGSAVIGPAVLAGVPAVLTQAGQVPGVDSNGNLHVGVLVQNIAYEKQVGIVYTTNNWTTFQNTFGTFLQTLTPASTPHQLNAESWEIVAAVGVGATGQFAVFYNVGGATYWDNNFGLNYSF